VHFDTFFNQFHDACLMHLECVMMCLQNERCNFTSPHTIPNHLQSYGLSLSFSSFSRPSKNVSFFGCFQTVPHRAGHLETFAESLLFVLAPLLLVLDRTAEVSQPGQRQVQGTLLAQRGATSNGIEGNSLGNS
jgi:hypothetical protein